MQVTQSFFCTPTHCLQLELEAARELRVHFDCIFTAQVGTLRCKVLTGLTQGKTVCQTVQGPESQGPRFQTNSLPVDYI